MRTSLAVILWFFFLTLTLTSWADPSRKIACLGDSLTEGDGDDRGQGYPGRLQSVLGSTYQVKSFGKSGWTAEMMLQGYEGQPSQVQRALDWGPQVTLIWVGSNDLWYLYEYNNPTTAAERADVENYRKLISESIVRLQKRKSRVVLGLLDDQSRRPVAVKGEAFTGISRAELSRMSLQVKAYNDALRELAKKHKLALVNPSEGGLFTDASRLSDDGNHPNSQGYDDIARQWLKALRP